MRTYIRTQTAYHAGRQQRKNMPQRRWYHALPRSQHAAPMGHAQIPMERRWYNTLPMVSSAVDVNIHRWTYLHIQRRPAYVPIAFHDIPIATDSHSFLCTLHNKSSGWLPKNASGIQGSDFDMILCLFRRAPLHPVPRGSPAKESCAFWKVSVKDWYNKCMLCKVLVKQALFDSNVCKCGEHIMLHGNSTGIEQNHHFWLKHIRRH